MSEPLVGVSVGTAVVMGLTQAPVAVAPTTAYLIIGDRCSHNCAFCAQAHDSQAGENLLSRVTWPRFTVPALLAALKEKEAAFQRVCVQATGAASAYSETLHLVRELKQAVSIPVDASVLPPNEAAVNDLFTSGLSFLGFGLDAATEAVYRRIKGGGWQHYQRLMAKVARDYPGHLAVHLIVGLGESEKEMAEAIQYWHDRGAIVGLFAFCPVPGTAMAHDRQPSLSTYRRLQVARMLISSGQLRTGQMKFAEDGRILSFNGAAANKAVWDGACFRTSGCPGCNRPFYNERPGGVQYNYARPLLSAEVRQAFWESEATELVALAEEPGNE